MGIIRKRVWITGSRKRKRVAALFDTGSTHTMIREDVAKELAPINELDEPITFKAAKGAFSVRGGIFASLWLGKHRIFISPPAVAGLTEEMIVGTDVLQHYNIRLDIKRHRVILDPRALILRA